MTPLIHLQDIARSYKSGEGEVEVIAVRSITRDIHRGEFVAIMGSSGSGKSTLMNMLGCLDQATSGDYFLDGINISELDRKQLAMLRNKKLGFVFQSFNLLARTSAIENVELPMLYTIPAISKHERRSRAIQALEKVGLGERLNHHPSQLSGGQQQRIAIARALVNQPEILLADEPTGNLDTRTSIDIMGIFQELNNAGITIIMVTHELDIAAYSKRILVMRDGEIISDNVNNNRSVAGEALALLNQAERNVEIS